MRAYPAASDSEGRLRGLHCRHLRTLVRHYRVCLRVGWWPGGLFSLYQRIPTVGGRAWCLDRLRLIEVTRDPAKARHLPQGQRAEPQINQSGGSPLIPAAVSLVIV